MRGYDGSGLRQAAIVDHDGQIRPASLTLKGLQEKVEIMWAVQSDDDRSDPLRGLAWVINPVRLQSLGEQFEPSLSNGLKRTFEGVSWSSSVRELCARCFVCCLV
jgi:hypothetical protein